MDPYPGEENNQRASYQYFSYPPSSYPQAANQQAEAALQNPYYLAEDLSLRYKNLIDAERKHFLEVENEYNRFIEKIDNLYRELEENYNKKLKECEDLKNDNKVLAKTLGNIYEDNSDKKATLKKLYYASTESNKKLKELENERDTFAHDVSIKQERYLNLEHEYRASLLQRNLLDERLSEAEAKFTAEMSRLRKVVDDRDKYIIELEHKLEEFSSENRRIYDQFNRLKLESESQKLNLDAKIHQQAIETEHLRSVLDEERARVKALAALAESHKAIAESRPNVVLSHPGQSESNFYQQESNRLRLELENAHLELRNAARTIDKLRTQNEQLEEKVQRVHAENKERKVPAVLDSEDFEEGYTQGSRRIERVPKRVVEKVVEREVFKDPDDVRRDLNRRLDRLMDIYRRNNARYLKPYLFFIWRLVIALQHLLARYKQAKAQIEDKGQTVENLNREIFVRDNKKDPTNIDKVLALYQSFRLSIIDIIFEVFVRSANHAFTKKINSLILFVVNVNELKERCYTVLELYLQSYFQLKEIVDEHNPEDPALEERFTQNALAKGNRLKNVDIEFRDSINAWIEDTIDHIDRQNSKGKKHEANAVKTIFRRTLIH